MKERRLYTYLPPVNTADTDGILSTASAPTGWEKYRDRLGLPDTATKEEVLEGLEGWEEGRSKAISVLTEPIGEDAPAVVRRFAENHKLYSIPSYEELVKRRLADRLYRVIKHRKGTVPTDHTTARKIDWSSTAPKPGGLGLSGVPHYLLVTTKGKIPAELVRREEDDLYRATSRELANKVAQVAGKYNRPVFFVTDGASITRNNGNPVIKRLRNKLIQEERRLGSDPYEDWGK